MKLSKLLLPKFLILILFGFNACVAPVGFGSHNAVLASETGVTYEYDHLFGGYERMTKAATEHCDKYKKMPFPKEKGARQTVSFVTLGLVYVHVQSFECR